jgi:hypothetical protein
LNAARLIAAAAVFGLWALPTSTATLAPGDAVSHIGETATVCGVVASAKFAANSRSQPTFLDFDRPYPNPVFTAVIFGSDRSKFGTPEMTLRGKRICVTGIISLYRGKAEVILRDPSQLSE